MINTHLSSRSGNRCSSKPIAAKLIYMLLSRSGLQQSPNIIFALTLTLLPSRSRNCCSSERKQAIYICRFVYCNLYSYLCCYLTLACAHIALVQRSPFLRSQWETNCSTFPLFALSLQFGAKVALRTDCNLCLLPSHSHLGHQWLRQILKEN